MEIEPINDYVLIEQDAYKTESETGILLPEHDETPPPTGTVYQAHKDSPVKSGDKVLFKPHMFDELVVNGKTYRTGSHLNIVGIFKNA